MRQKAVVKHRVLKLQNFIMLTIRGRKKGRKIGKENDFRFDIERDGITFVDH